MRVFIGFDDTDVITATYGTGKVVRWFIPQLPKGCSCRGVVRQQLLVDPAVPYTSHNSAACMLVDIPSPDRVPALIANAMDHIGRYAAVGSDPGLCVAPEGRSTLAALTVFGQRCTHALVSQAEAMRAARGIHLSGHGGTNDGIIGAAAAVGLTASGWSGRYIECGDLRSAPESMTVAELQGKNIEVVAEDRDARVPAPADRVRTHFWIRPRLLGHRPVLLVRRHSEGVWENIYGKRRKPTSRRALP